MAAYAKERHPGLSIIAGDVHDLELEENFDYVILSDLVNDLWDVQAVFDAFLRFANPERE